MGCRSFQIRYAAHFSARQFLPSVRSFLIAATTWYSGFFQLSFVTRFAFDNGQLATIWIWVSSEVITICIIFSVYGLSVDQLITSLLAKPCWRDPARSKQLSTVAILAFQFGLYRVVAPLSFLHSISLAALLTDISNSNNSKLSSTQVRRLNRQSHFCRT